jgi:helicase MOV-10
VPGKEFHLVVTFRPTQSHLGRCTTNLELLFEDTSRSRFFVVVRSATAIVGNQADHEALAPKAPYVRRPPRRGYKIIHHSNVVPAERTGMFIRNPYSVRLDQYLVPQDLRDSLENGPQDVGEVIRRLPSAYSPTILSRSTYVKNMNAQLWIEEHKAV